MTSTGESDAFVGGELRASAERAILDPSVLSPSEMRRICQAYIDLLDRQDDIILQPRFPNIPA